MHVRPLTLALVLALFLLSSAPIGIAPSHPERAPAVDRAVIDDFETWWRDATCDYAPESDCEIGTAFKDAIGLAGLGIDPSVWPAASDDVEAWILAHAEEWDNATGLGPGPSLAMAALALDANHDVSSVTLLDGSTRDLGAEIVAAADDNQTFGSVNGNSWAAFGLNVAGERGDVLDATLAAIAEAQDSSGGWGWDEGQPADPDTTSWALNALALGQGHEDAIESAVAYLEGLQIEEGEERACWPGYDGNASAATTSVVLPALIVAGVDPADWSVGGRSPWDCFAAFQKADGSFDTAFEAYQTARALGAAPLGVPVDSHGATDTTSETPERTTLTPSVGAIAAIAAMAGFALWRKRS